MKADMLLNSKTTCDFEYLICEIRMCFGFRKPYMLSKED